MNLCVVFDIDETMVQYYSRGGLDSHDSPLFETSAIEHLDSDDGSRLYFRPGLKKFLDFAKNTDKITLGIWTYGNQVYARFIEKAITDFYHLEKSPFHFVYSVNEIKKDLQRGLQEKDVRRIMQTYKGEFTRANTFLVDNRPANIHHNANCQNGFIVESFDLRNPKYRVEKDHVFADLEKICRRILRKGIVPGSQDPIFSKTNIELMCIKKYHRKYRVNDEIKEIMSSESVDEDARFTPLRETRKTRKRSKSRKTVNNKRN